MVSTNYNPEIAIVYASVTGNTEALSDILVQSLQSKGLEPSIYKVTDFALKELSHYDIVIVGTYTWGSGEVPAEMTGLFQAFERLNRKELVTAVFGTGDSFFAEYCGAVDRFRDMLYVHTNLAATLKVELLPQERDKFRCNKFIEVVLEREWAGVSGKD